MKYASLALAALMVGCGSGGSSSEGTSPDGAADAGPVLDGAVLHSPSDAGSDALDPCADAAVPPSSLECTGLYADFATKEVSPNAFAYTPATPLWSDGAQKQRWIELPPKTTIDISNPDEWTFPVGTKLFKEFRVNGKRVETRLFQKMEMSPSFWVYATYAWNADDSAAIINYGGPVPVPGGDGGLTWTIPTNDDCDECHRGRQDRILGFEQVGLGLPLAQGLTLAGLAAMGLVTPPPASISLTIGDDGTGLDPLALGWIHVNCGVTCHNSNPTAAGYAAGMLLRLDPTQLDGSPPDWTTWDILRTTINVPCISGGLIGEPRIVPGNPQQSVIHELIDQRGELQMPPIASLIVDTADVAVIASWIQALPNDAGAPDAGTESDAAGEGLDAQPESDAKTTDAVGEDAQGDAGPITDATADSPASMTGDASATNDAGTAVDASTTIDASSTGDASSEGASTADAESDDGGTE